MIKSELNIIIKAEDNFDGMEFNQDLSDIKSLIITLPKTPVPFDHGSDNRKNVHNFAHFIKKCLTDTMEQIKIIEYWPMNPATAFEGLNAELLAPKLTIFDFGFLGYNVLEETNEGQNILSILGSGFLRQTQFLWETRISIYDHQASELLKYQGMSFKISWEGTDVQKYINKLIKQQKKVKK